VEAAIDKRLARVEAEVVTMREDFSVFTRDMDVVKGDLKSLGNILNRIETGVLRAQEKAEERSERNKPNLTAIVSVLITIISILVGGAWLIGGSLSTLTVRTTESLRERDEMRIEMRQLDQRTWDLKHDAPQVSH